MASSGSFNTGSSKGRYLTFSWSLSSQSVANNTSTISWSLKGAGDSGYVVVSEVKVTIDGSQAYYRDESNHQNVYVGTTVASGTKTITHNADGSRSFSVSVSAGIYEWAINKSGSGSWTLTTIPRAATISSAPNFTDEGSPQITYSNKAGTAVSTLQACIADSEGKEIFVPYRDISKTGTSYTFSFTSAEKEALQKAVLSGSNTRNVRFYIKTVIGSTTLYSSSLKTLTITNATPGMSATVTDTNSKTTALTGDSSKLIRYYSNAKVAMNPSFKKHATAKSYKITNGDKNITAASGTFTAVEKNKFEFSVTDTRGLTASQTITSTMVNYVHLTCNLEVNRPNALGEMTFKVHGNYFNGSFGSVANTLTLYYSMEAESGGISATQITPTFNGNTYSIEVPLTGLDYRNKYTFKAWAEDKLEKAETPEIVTYTLPVFDWSKEDFNFNVPVTFNAGYTVADGASVIGDTPTTDFVIEQGKMAGWNFRRWNSGIAECWFISEPASFSISTAWGNIYAKDNAFPGYAYPFEFESLPVVSIQPYATDGNFWCFTGSGASTTQSPSVSAVRPTSYSVTGARISMHVIGREKR